MKKKIVYKADDGKQFDTEEECNKYDNDLVIVAILKEAFESYHFNLDSLEEIREKLTICLK